MILGAAVAACAAYGGRGLQPGVSTLAEVEAAMGTPSLRWQNQDGGQTLAFPRGPSGVHTFMAEVGADGRLKSLRNVLEPGRFAQVRTGMGKEEVLRLLGPPAPESTAYFEHRGELAWEWRYCDDWNEPARFTVLIDDASGEVRSAFSQTEQQRASGIHGDRRGWCSR